MIKEIIAEGKDVEDAIDRGAVRLGFTRDEVEFEIIALPKKGFFGLKTYPAKVRVFKEVPDEKPAAPKAEKKTEAPKAERKPMPKAEHPKAEEKKPAAPKAEKKPMPKKEAEHTAPKAEKEENDGESGLVFKRVPVTPSEEVVAKVTKSAEYLKEVILAMGYENVDIVPNYYEDCVSLQLKGAQLGVIIGRRGETLDSLQYLASLVANRGEGEYVRINIDSGNYREKREKTLIALAHKLANQAVKTGKSTTLEPMNPYERRIIHGAVSEVEGAVSTSVGVDPQRRVVISSANAPKRGDRSFKGRRGGKDSKGYDRRRKGDNRRPHRDAPKMDKPAENSGAVTEAKPINDAELFADLPMGVPLVSGIKAEKKVTAPKAAAPKHDDAKDNADAPALYGKLM